MYGQNRRLQRVGLMMMMASLVLGGCESKKPLPKKPDKVPLWLKKKPTAADKAAAKKTETALLGLCSQRDALYEGFVRLLEAHVGEPKSVVDKAKAYVKSTAPRIQKLNNEIGVKVKGDETNAHGRCMKQGSAVAVAVGDRFRKVVAKLGAHDEPLRKLKRQIDDALFLVRVQPW